MKICPQCGDNVLDSASVRCSSCGGDLEVAPPERDGHQDSTTPERPPEKLDDTSPIEKSDDLELVQGGQAFWTEDEKVRPPSRPNPDPPPAPPQPHNAEQPVPAPEKPKLNPSVIFADDRPARHAPSLAELAAQRKAQTESDQPDTEASSDDSGSESTSRVRTGDNATDGDTETEPTAPKPIPPQTAEEKRTAAGAPAPMAESTMRFPSAAAEPTDDTRPEGVRVQPEQSTAPPVEGENTPRPNLTVVAKAPDVAFLDGNKIVVPGQRWTTGETVVISGHTYQLKRTVQKYPLTPKQALALAGAFLGGMLFAWLWFSGQSVPSARIFGVIQNAEDRKLLAGVTVAIEDNGRTTESDPTGMFHFGDLNDGIYTLVATDPIYGKSRTSVTVAGDVTTVLLNLEGSTEELSSTAPPTNTQGRPARAETSTPPEEPGSPATASKAPGKLAVTASVPNAKIFLDGKMLGVGNSVYTGIRPGKRKIRVEHSDFKPWEKTVTVTAGKTTRIEPELVAEKPPEPQKLTPEQYAAAGRRFMESRQYKLALEQFNMAIDGAPRAQFYAWRADAYAGLKELPAAEGDFLTAMALFRKQNDATRLDDLLQRAVLVVPGSAALNMAYADYHYANRHLIDAEKYYRRAIELGGDPVKAYIGIGLVNYTGGSFDGALESWTRADEATGQMDPHLAGYLALANARLQHRASCRKAVERLAAHPDVLEQFRGHPDWDRVQRLTGDG